MYVRPVSILGAGLVPSFETNASSHPMPADYPFGQGRVSIDSFLTLLLQADPAGVLNPTEPETGAVLGSRHLK